MVEAANFLSFTLDTNCMIDLEEGRSSAASVRSLLAASEVGGADLALVASSASERQVSGEFLRSIDDFNARRAGLGLGGLKLLPSIGRWGISFFGNSLYGSDADIAREFEICSALFPNSPYEWADFASDRRENVEDTTSRAYLRWRNQMLDVQAIWAHENAARDVFVTSDQRLHILNGQPGFSAIRVRSPAEAAALL